MRIAVIGAGPIGLEAATEATARGHEVVVLEAGEHPAASVRQWSHIHLFTPWSMNTTRRGRAVVGPLHGDPDACPTGAELADVYLDPLAAPLDVRVRNRVVHIGRGTHRKGDALGGPTRAEDPFRILVETPDGEALVEADAILDCTGTWLDPAPAGRGGVPAVGERAAAAAGKVQYGPVPVDGLAGRRVAVVGDGASAATVLRDLLALRPEPRITWVTLSPTGPSFVSPPGDPLADRAALFETALGAPARVDHRPGRPVVGLEASDSGVRVTLEGGDTFDVDQVIACTGFRPDHRLSRELQVHVCWGTEGPMKLAGALLSAQGGKADCLDGGSQGAEVLRSPEPRFFVLGSKSYGRRSDFLLARGHEQIMDVMELLER
jgi:thioredoxin reductase